MCSTDHNAYRSNLSQVTHSESNKYLDGHAKILQHDEIYS